MTLNSDYLINSYNDRKFVNNIQQTTNTTKVMLSQQERENIKIVWNGMDAILHSKSEKVVDESFDRDFIQHNPWAKDGVEHIKEMLAFEFDYKPIRWIADGDIMVYHGYYTAPNPLGELPLLCVDMWRIQSGRIKEHWDALSPLSQEQVSQATAGEGNGELDLSKDEIEANKATIIRFLDHVLNRGKVGEIPNLVSDSYTYHHETAGELSGIAYLEDHIVNKNGGRMPHDTKRVIASGDLVMSHAHLFGENERVAFDWFRMDSNHKIAEHWSVEQPITPIDQVANDHPHF